MRCKASQSRSGSPNPRSTRSPCKTPLTTSPDVRSSARPRYVGPNFSRPTIAVNTFSVDAGCRLASARCARMVASSALRMTTAPTASAGMLAAASILTTEAGKPAVTGCALSNLGDDTQPLRISSTALARSLNRSMLKPVGNEKLAASWPAMEFRGTDFVVNIPINRMSYCIYPKAVAK